MQTTKPALRNTQALARLDFNNPKFEEAVRSIVCKGATNGEATIFLHIAVANRLDPFFQEIYWLPKIGPYVSLKGFLKIADRDYGRVYEGIEQPIKILYVNGEQITEERTIKSQLFSATARVHRNDRQHPSEFEAIWTSYYKKGHKNWEQYPELMLKEKAMRGALMFAFPIPGAAGANIDVDERDLPHYEPQVEPPPVKAIKPPDLPISEPVPPDKGECVGPPPKFPESKASEESKAIFDQIPLRIKAFKLITEIHEQYFKKTNIDVISTKAFGMKIAYQHIATCEDVALLKKAVAYCENYLAKRGAKK